MLRILFVAPFPPPIHGSAIVSQQIKDSKLIRESFNCDFVNLSTSRSMNEIGKRNPAKIWRFLASFCITFWKLLTHRYNLCYLAITCHGSGFLKDAPFVVLCKLFRRKVVIHQHNKGMSMDIDRWPYRWLLPLVYRNTKVILLSWHLYPDIERIVKREQVLVCPNGISNNIPERMIHNNDVPRLLFLSNLLISKGVYVLLDACKILKDNNISFFCDFVGAESKEISEANFKKEVSKRGLDNLVQYYGRKYGKEKNKFFEQSDIFVFPTFYECFGLVLLEAMSYSLPCVTTDEGGIPDIVQDGVNGLIAKRQDPQSLAECLMQLIGDPMLQRKMGETGRKRLDEHFTETAFEEKMRDILQACC